MKKVIILLFLVLFLTTGCVNVSKSEIDAILNEGMSSRLDLSNVYRTGYKYHLPNGIGVYEQNGYNEVLRSGDYKYFMYVDIVSFYNKVIEEYEEKSGAYYSKAIHYKDKFGYLEIKEWKDTKYLIEIMYNYAKIEVIVEKRDIKKSVANAISILSSIEYNKSILSNLMGENVLQFKEQELNIFETKKPNNDLLIYEDDTEDTKQNGYRDPDLIE